MRSKEAEEYARKVADGLIRRRGWDPKSVPDAVRNDVFATMSNHDATYLVGFALGVDPDEVAKDIQDAEWDLDAARELA